MKKSSIVLAFITLILCIVLFAIKATGPVIHIVAGVMLTVVSVSHLWSRIRRMRYMKLSWTIVDIVLIASLMAMFGSGMILHLLRELFVVKIAHKLSSLLFVIVLIVHCIQHLKKQKA